MKQGQDMYWKHNASSLLREVDKETYSKLLLANDLERFKAIVAELDSSNKFKAAYNVLCNANEKIAQVILATVFTEMKECENKKYKADPFWSSHKLLGKRADGSLDIIAR